jgi:hypothetical protein
VSGLPVRHGHDQGSVVSSNTGGGSIDVQYQNRMKNPPVVASRGNNDGDMNVKTRREQHSTDVRQHQYNN